MNRMAMALGCILACAPALALANQDDSQTGQNQMQQEGTNQQKDVNEQNVMGTQRILPKDAKLVGAVESTDVRAFPEQMTKTSKQNVQKEDVVGAAALDRVWTTKQSYSQTVRHLDQKVKGEGMQELAKTKTQASTAWNLRMPDGHIANIVVRNTKPTTIESVQLAASEATVPSQQGAMKNKGIQENQGQQNQGIQGNQGLHNQGSQPNQPQQPMNEQNQKMNPSSPQQNPNNSQNPSNR